MGGLSESAVPPSFAVADVVVPERSPAASSSSLASLILLFLPTFIVVAMSDLCPVYAPFFGAMVSSLVAVVLRVLTQHARAAPAPSYSPVSTAYVSESPLEGGPC